MKIIMKIDNIIFNTIRIVVAAMLFVVMCVLFAAVVFRYFINRPLNWADEMCTYLLVSITFLGAYLAQRKGGLARVTFFIDKLPPKARLVIDLIGKILVAALLVLITYQGILMLQQPTVRIQRTVALQWPIMIFYAQIPLMSILMLFGIFIDIAALIAPDKVIPLDKIEKGVEDPIS